MPDEGTCDESIYEPATHVENLTNAHAALGDWSAKKDLLQHVLRIMEAHYGKDRYEVAAALTNLANAYSLFLPVPVLYGTVFEYTGVLGCSAGGQLVALLEFTSLSGGRSDLREGGIAKRRMGAQSGRGGLIRA